MEVNGEGAAEPTRVSSQPQLRPARQREARAEGAVPSAAASRLQRRVLASVSADRNNF